MGKTAIYAGSFDPITVGHLDIVQRAASIFDRVIVAVGNNPAKRYFFELEQREALVQEAVAASTNVEVVRFSGLLVHTCQELGADVILRGLRSVSDFEPEFRYGLANRDLSGIETMFLISDPQHLFVSSSIVKEIATNGGDVAKYVPECVLAAILDKEST
ncbi:MAG: pantetheine-phosphate adenylyltransferase [Proteobacteria bacterium]|nr:pantetheine-phosphate adenylyltransferase [Pseudomonadota bacterium]